MFKQQNGAYFTRPPTAVLAFSARLTRKPYSSDAGGLAVKIIVAGY